MANETQKRLREELGKQTYFSKPSTTQQSFEKILRRTDKNEHLSVFYLIPKVSQEEKNKEKIIKNNVCLCLLIPIRSQQGPKEENRARQVENSPIGRGKSAQGRGAPARRGVTRLSLALAHHKAVCTLLWQLSHESLQTSAF